MPSKDSHVAAAHRNQAAIDFLTQDLEAMSEWVVTVAFYKALHVIEAVFAADPHSPQKHTDDHRTRNRVLRTEKRYAHLWKLYRPLWNASLIARYLRADENGPTHDAFSTYMPPEVVKSLVLGHYLKQIEKSAGKLLGDERYFDTL